MSNFRFISYLYEYKKEQKGRNTGFVRVRGLNDFIELNLQVKPAKGTYQIYVHYETLPEVKSILVGTIRAVNGECHGVFHNILPILRKEGLSFSAIEALTIWQDDVICHGTDWSESKCLERFLNEYYKKQGSQEWIRASELETDEGTVEEIEIEEVEINETEIKEVEEIKEIKEAEAEEIKIEEQEEEQEGELENTYSIEREERLNEKESSTKAEDVEQLIQEIIDSGEERGSEEKEKPATLGWPKPKTIEELMLQLKTIPSFGNDSFLKCVKIMPKDIGLLNADDWYLGKNSFLLHGYFAYQYLMLGYIRFQDGGKQAVLGVPGVYNNKDKYLAELFGFTNFIQAKQQEIKTGTFGYWITSVHENI
ncbi:MAG: hypothetical protein IJA32_16615 [Lachnospiraceae bacterium]|nr:hypothetical protein [Lachnospiraceae bacterium]